jgi:acetyl-CoA acetyltransferase
MTERTIRGRAAIVGVGETTYYKRGQAKDAEFKMCLEAVMAAVADAGIPLEEVDGFASYSGDRNDPPRIAAALNLPELKFSNMQWGGGGGGGSAAVGNAVAAVAAGYADCVVVFRALAQGQFGRFGQAGASSAVSGNAAYAAPYGLFSPAQMYALRVRRFMHQYGVQQDALKAIALTSYHHAQQNERAVMYGRPLTPEAYDNSRWIVEPFHLFDCCMENDGAAAMVIVSAERAKDLQQKPAYVIGHAQGSDRRQSWGHNDPNLGSANFQTVAPRMWAMAGASPQDVDVAQVYENFTGGVLMSIVEHGFCAPEEANEFLTPERLRAPDGAFPLNTSGGNLAECYMHGLELIIEAVRQIRGESPNQVPDVELSFVASGPMVSPVSDLLLASHV